MTGRRASSTADARTGLLGGCERLEAAAGAALARSFRRGRAHCDETRDGRAETAAIPGTSDPKTGTGGGPAAIAAADRGAAIPVAAVGDETRDGAAETAAIPGTSDPKPGTGGPAVPEERVAAARAWLLRVLDERGAIRVGPFHEATGPLGRALAGLVEEGAVEVARTGDELLP